MLKGGGVKYNRVVENIIRLFVEGSEDVHILKGNLDIIDFSSPDLLFLHPGWNTLDMNGDLKDGFFIGNFDSVEKMQKITQVDFYKFNGRKLYTGMFSYAGFKEIILPDTIEDIENACFTSDTLLTNIILPKNIKTISDSLLDNCKSLKEITIPEGVLEIGNYSFGRTNIEKIVIPHSVKKIGYNFYSLDNGKNGSVRFQSLIPPEFELDTFERIDRIEVPMAAVETYKNIDIPGWKENVGDKIVGY